MSRYGRLVRQEVKSAKKANASQFEVMRITHLGLTSLLLAITLVLFAVFNDVTYSIAASPILVWSVLIEFIPVGKNPNGDKIVRYQFFIFSLVTTLLALLSLGFTSALLHFMGVSLKPLTTLFGVCIAIVLLPFVENFLSLLMTIHEPDEDGYLYPLSVLIKRAFRKNRRSVFYDKFPHVSDLAFYLSLSTYDKHCFAPFSEHFTKLKELYIYQVDKKSIDLNVTRKTLNEIVDKRFYLLEDICMLQTDGTLMTSEAVRLANASIMDIFQLFGLDPDSPLEVEEEPSEKEIQDEKQTKLEQVRKVYG